MYYYISTKNVYEQASIPERIKRALLKDGINRVLVHAKKLGSGDVVFSAEDILRSISLLFVPLSRKKIFSELLQINKDKEVRFSEGTTCTPAFPCEDLID
jgi:hypothetical protein